MTPKQIVNELDRYIIGQFQAKKAVAIALRNRYRRSKLSLSDREEITPKNIILKGPCQACQSAVFKGGGDQVYRGGLCRTRRRKYGARPCRSINPLS